MVQAFCLILSPLILLLASLVLDLTTTDLLVGGPSLVPYGVTAALAGVCCLNLAYRGYYPPALKRLAQAGWIGIIVLASHYVATGASSQHVPAGPALRAQITGIKGGRNEPTNTTIVLQDGSSVTTYDYRAGAYGSMGRCLTVRRVSAPSGFVWLKIVDASPLPSRGQLAWPIEQTACFTATELHALR